MAAERGTAPRSPFASRSEGLALQGSEQPVEDGGGQAAQGPCHGLIVQTAELREYIPTECILTESILTAEAFVPNWRGWAFA
jgi:hypothetical protein